MGEDLAGGTINHHTAYDQDSGHGDSGGGGSGVGCDSSGGCGVGGDSCGGVGCDCEIFSGDFFSDRSHQKSCSEVEKADELQTLTNIQVSSLR